MDLITELTNLGVDVNEGLERVMGDNSLYEMMLGMFIGSVNDNPVNLSDFDAGSVDALIERIHMLKGVTGNLALTPLFNSYTETLGLLRGGKTAQAKEKFEQLLPLQAQIIDCINRHTGA